MQLNGRKMKRTQNKLCLYEAHRIETICWYECLGALDIIGVRVCVGVYIMITMMMRLVAV